MNSKKNLRHSSMANQQVKCNRQVFYFSPIVVDLNKSKLTVLLQTDPLLSRAEEPWQ